MSTSLDDLVQIGVVHSRNRLSLEDLLKPTDEVAFSHDNQSPRELTRAVANALDVDNSEEVHVGSEFPDEDIPAPTYRQVLEAVITIEHSLLTITRTDPFAPKLRSQLMHLARLKRQQQAKTLKETDIRDYFTRP